MEWQNHWIEFEEALKSRLTVGAQTYGSDSFVRIPQELLGEMEEEALDIIGWGFILWVRLRKLRAMMEEKCPAS